MIRNLKKRLTLIFICSVMGIFTLVFCLFIKESIQSEKENDINYFGRMTTYLVFQIENSSDLEQDLATAGKTYNFILFSKKQNHTFMPANFSDIDINTLITSFEQELKKVNMVKTDTIPYSSQSGTFSFITPNNRSFYGIQVEVLTQDNNNLEFYVIKEATTSLTILKEHLSFYIATWIIVFIMILLLTKLLISKAMKPTENALQSQKEFIAAVSHELKSPLAVILASAECIGSDATLSQETKQHSEIIDSECLRMSNLVQDLLLLSSVDANTWTLNKSNIDVDTLLINTYEKYEPICRQKGIHFKLNPTDELFPALNADINRINQILSIFIDNAITYSSSGSEICVDTAVSKNTLTFSIIDHGTGIKDTDKPFIYDRFYCADKSRTQKEHYGLGLSIAKELVEMHRGTISLSDTQGGGCTFKISFPI